MKFDNANNEGTKHFLQIWDDAFRQFGFICLINHGLEEYYQGLYQAVTPFFDLPLEDKLAFRVSANYGHGGYTPQGQESVSRTYLENEQSRPPDAVESLSSSGLDFSVIPCTRNGYHSDIIRDRSLQLKNKLDEFTIDVMTIMARCLTLPDDYFLDFYRDNRASNVMRMANYLPLSDNRQMRYGEHTDYTGFTFLWRNSDNGLQCLDPRLNDTWIDIPSLPEHQDALIINAGELIQRWTNDYWISNVHRVLSDANATQAGAFNPLSIVYFTGPNDDTKINVLHESDKVQSMGSINEDYQEEITAGEHLWRKLNASNT